MVCRQKENKKSSALFESPKYYMIFGGGYDICCIPNCN